MIFSRVWAMPDRYTFRIAPVASLLARYMGGGRWVDPFAGMTSKAQVRNDLSPESPAEFHLEAREFCEKIDGPFDGILFDPPYSPRQISECYKSVGLDVCMEDTQSAALYSSCRDWLAPKLKSGGIAISFGWNTVGFGAERGFDLIEIMLVCHGGAHNDTIVTVERKLQGELFGSRSS